MKILFARILEWNQIQKFSYFQKIIEILIHKLMHDSILFYLSLMKKVVESQKSHNLIIRQSSAINMVTVRASKTMLSSWNSTHVVRTILKVNHLTCQIDNTNVSPVKMIIFSRKPLDSYNVSNKNIVLNDDCVFFFCSFFFTKNK